MHSALEPHAQGSAQAPFTHACDSGQSEFALHPTGITDPPDAGRNEYNTYNLRRVLGLSIHETPVFKIRTRYAS